MPSIQYKIHGEITGPIVMIGFGSIAKGVLPLIDRHLKYDHSRFVVVSPVIIDADRVLLEEYGIKYIIESVTEENYKELLTPLLRDDAGGQGFCVNLSVNTGSVDLLLLTRELGALYIDTVIEPWPGFYYNPDLGPADRTNYALREELLSQREKSPGGTTAVSTCGANPGMVSWLLKQALLNIAADTHRSEDGEEYSVPVPATREEWALLAQKLGVKGIHIAEKDSQVGKQHKKPNEFINTWSVEGFISEGMQPAELGWGSHERWFPSHASEHAKGCGAAIYINQPGGNTRVRSWVPSGPQFGFLVTHNESISISDHFTVRDHCPEVEGEGRVIYRPTCHYAYHPCNDAVLSLHEMFGKGQIPQIHNHHILNESEIVSGGDELGVLLYGMPTKNAYWYGSQLSIEETRKLAPHQNATVLQVTSAVLAGMVWALENPTAGIVEADDMDHKRCLELQTQYLGTVKGVYTDWTPLSDASRGFFPGDIDESDPWQFRNILLH